MKIKLEKIVQEERALDMLSKMKFPVKISYWLSKINNKAQKEIELFKEQRLKLIMEMGKKQEDGSTKVEDKFMEKYQKQVQELLDIEVEFDFEPIKISDLGNIEIEPNMLVNWIFTE